MDDNVIKSIATQAAKHGVEVNAALAIFEVESSGVPFWNVDGKMLPPIRWEGHYFYARLNDKAQQQAAVAQGLASPKAGAIPNPPSFAGRYALLERAKTINPTAALESCSWGLGQVMGANWQSLGYASVNELVTACDTIDGQVDMVFRYIDTNGLSDDLNTHNWSAFKDGYNGKAANGYEKKIADAYLKYSGEVIAPQHDEIFQLQKMLNVIGDYNIKLDGNMADDTKAALRDFQLKNGLTVDGIYGPISKAAIQKAYLAKSAKTTTNAGVGGLTIGTLGTGLSEAAKSIQGFASTSQIIQYVFVGLIVIGAAITAFAVFMGMRNKS